MIDEIKQFVEAKVENLNFAKSNSIPFHRLLDITSELNAYKTVLDEINRIQEENK